MNYKWTKQSIGWFLDSSEYTHFHKKAAEIIVPFLNRDDTLCDVGCGLGRLDIELSPYLAEITAIDSEALVIENLQEICKEKGVKNLNALCADAYQNLRSHDVFLISFFGGEGQMEQCIPYCRKKLIRLVNASNKGNLYPNRHRKTEKTTISILETLLNEKELSYEKIEVSLEFGQPLRSEQDAKNFVSYNAPNATDHEIEQFLNDYAINTKHPDFPIYIPNNKEIGIFSVTMEGGANEHI